MDSTTYQKEKDPVDLSLSGTAAKQPQLGAYPNIKNNETNY